ncbi:MAG: DUF4886 domain-containing protein [Bacteroidales bacterium]|nr:DUF4886 domain-containing protein [Bacteroidales bacterium]
MNRKFFSRLLASAILVLVAISASAKAKDPIKVLAIGNSFSLDAVEQNLYEIGNAAGVPMIIGNMYIPGCSIDRHVENIKGDLPAYSYRKVGKDGVKRTTDDIRLSQVINDEKWDYISVQQVSQDSGILESYAQLGELLAWIRSKAPKAKIVLHQTWAYAKNATHDGFVNYDRSQYAMYDAIMNATRNVADQHKLKKVIPSGTAIQNARSTNLGDNLTRDGFHLDHHLGQYIAAATWFEALTGKTVVGNVYCPSGVTNLELRIAQNAAHNAVKKPFKVTKQ